MIYPFRKLCPRSLSGNFANAGSLFKGLCLCNFLLFHLRYNLFVYIQSYSQSPLLQFTPLFMITLDFLLGTCNFQISVPVTSIASVSKTFFAITTSLQTMQILHNILLWQYQLFYSKITNLHSLRNFCDNHCATRTAFKLEIEYFLDINVAI